MSGTGEVTADVAAALAFITLNRQQIDAGDLDARTAQLAEMTSIAREAKRELLLGLTSVVDTLLLMLSAMDPLHRSESELFELLAAMHALQAGAADE